MSEYPDVLLFGWWQGLKADDRNAMSYGGWIWKLIVELQNLVYLFEARLKIQHNFTGLIPEFVNVVDGNPTFRVKIRQLLPTRRPKPLVFKRGESLNSKYFRRPENDDRNLQRVIGHISPASPAKETVQKSAWNIRIPDYSQNRELDRQIIIDSRRKEWVLLDNEPLVDGEIS
ncbi:hypothetical protein ACFX2J_007372 [Malus domestica]